MNAIETLIAEARTSQAQQQAEYAEERFHNQMARRDLLLRQIRETFSAEIVDALGIQVVSLDTSYDGDQYGIFTFRGKSYHLRTYVQTYDRYWQLVRMDERDEDDARRMPAWDQHRPSIEQFLLGLDSLSHKPEAAPRCAHIPTAPAPRVMEEHEAQLIDAFRQWMQYEQERA